MKLDSYYPIIFVTSNPTFQEVAVKILMEQDFHAERYKEFLREVCAAKNLNIFFL